MATLLIGYDVEACAIGEGLACLGAHGMGEAIDRTTTAKALEIIRRNHEEHGVPATLFVCGRTLVHNVEALEPFVDHPLFDIQQHTYSHTLLKDDHWKGGTFLASPSVAIEQEVRQTSEALQRLLGVECIGLRTPHGYHLGLTDRPEMLAALQRCGIRFVSSWARNAEGVNPTPLSRAAVLVRRAGLSRPPRDPVPALARRHLVRGVRHRPRRGLRRRAARRRRRDRRRRPRVRGLLPRLGPDPLPRGRDRVGRRADQPTPSEQGADLLHYAAFHDRMRPAPVPS